MTPITLIPSPTDLSRSALTSLSKGPSAPVLIQHQIIRIPVSDLETILATIKREKRTGSLTIHFSQGCAGGYAEFKQETR